MFLAATRPPAERVAAGPWMRCIRFLETTWACAGCFPASWARWCRVGAPSPVRESTVANNRRWRNGRFATWRSRVNRSSRRFSSNGACPWTFGKDVFSQKTARGAVGRDWGRASRSKPAIPTGAITRNTPRTILRVVHGGIARICAVAVALFGAFLGKNVADGLGR
ncbi:MAG: hypothetical protein RL077_413 [Verrucomicrobiota bacterium]